MATQAEQIAELKALLKIAADHLEQYRNYSEDLRTIGRGCSILSAYQPETLSYMLRSALRDHKRYCRRCDDYVTGKQCPRCASRGVLTHTQPEKNMPVEDAIVEVR